MQCPQCREVLLDVKMNSQTLYEHFDLNRKSSKKNKKFKLCTKLKEYFNENGRVVYVK